MHELLSQSNWPPVNRQEDMHDHNSVVRIIRQWLGLIALTTEYSCTLKVYDDSGIS